MSKRCGYAECQSTSHSGIRLYESPHQKKGNLRCIWLRHCNKYINFSQNKFYVCEKHFKKGDIIRNTRKKHLKEDAAPRPAKDCGCLCSEYYTDPSCVYTRKTNLYFLYFEIRELN